MPGALIRYTGLLLIMLLVPANSYALFGLEKLKRFKPISKKVEIQMGQGIAAKILGATPLVNDPELQQYVNRVGKWVALQTERPNLPWHFGVIDTDTINAFATPGGYILITRGLLMMLRDESELAGILAHEISHAVRKHVLRTIRKQSLADIGRKRLNKMAEEKGSGNYKYLVNSSTEAFSRGLDKKDEYAADRMGVVLAARAGYEPFGMATVLQRLSAINPKDTKLTLMFNTHPDPDKRLQKLMEAVGTQLDAYAKQPRGKERFQKIMKAHIARYVPTKRKKSVFDDDIW